MTKINFQPNLAPAPAAFQKVKSGETLLFMLITHMIAADADNNCHVDFEFNILTQVLDIQSIVIQSIHPSS